MNQQGEFQPIPHPAAPVSDLPGRMAKEGSPVLEKADRKYPHSSPSSTEKRRARVNELGVSRSPQSLFWNPKNAPSQSDTAD